MARKTKDIDAGTIKVRVTQFGAGEAPLALARAVRLLGDTLTASAAEKMLAFCRGFEDGDFLWMRTKLLENSKQVFTANTSTGETQEVVSSTPLKLDAFDDDLQAQFTWFFEAIMHNFADFLVAALSSGHSQQAKTPDGSTSPAPSTGESGASSPTHVSASA